MRLRAREPLHFKRSHWWKRGSRSKFASHCSWGTYQSKWMQDGCKVYRDGHLNGIEWIMFYDYLDYFPKPPLGGRPNKNSVDLGTPNVHNHLFILFYHAWGPAWIEIPRTNFRSRARSHMTPHSTWGSVTTLHDFEGLLDRPWDTFFWALTISWSRP